MDCIVVLLNMFVSHSKIQVVAFILTAIDRFTFQLECRLYSE